MSGWHDLHPWTWGAFALWSHPRTHSGPNTYAYSDSYTGTYTGAYSHSDSNADPNADANSVRR
jgi:hypothetical protein